MLNLQEVFNRVHLKQKELREVREMYRDQLQSTREYQDILEDLEALKLKKKQLELDAWEALGNRDKHDVLKLDIKSDKELMSDMALTSYVNGEDLKVTDPYETEYEPKFSVSFKKANSVSKQTI